MNKGVNRTRASRGLLLQQLQRLVGGQESRVEGQGQEKKSGSQLSTLDSRISSGTAAIDRLLPGGGLRRGMLVEWVERADAETGRQGDKERVGINGSPCLLLSLSPCLSLSLLAAREACHDGGVLVVIDRERTFYPPAAAAWGIDLCRLIVVRPVSVRDQLWAAVQSLRSPAVAAVWMAIDRLDDRAFRRLQLAAQAGGTLGVLVRPASAAREPSWADVRLSVRCPSSVVRCLLDSYNGLRTTDHGRRTQVHVLRCRQGRAGGAVWVEIDDVAHEVREVEKGYRLSALGYQPGRLADGR